jgi:hypothetical protein
MKKGIFVVHAVWLFFVASQVPAIAAGPWCCKCKYMPGGSSGRTTSAATQPEIQIQINFPGDASTTAGAEEKCKDYCSFDSEKNGLKYCIDLGFVGGVAETMGLGVKVEEIGVLNRCVTAAQSRTQCQAIAGTPATSPKATAEADCPEGSSAQPQAATPSLTAEQLAKLHEDILRERRRDEQRARRGQEIANEEQAKYNAEKQRQEERNAKITEISEILRTESRVVGRPWGDQISSVASFVLDSQDWNSQSAELAAEIRRRPPLRAF